MPPLLPVPTRLRRGLLLTLASVVVMPLMAAGPAFGEESDEAQCPDPVPTEAETEFEAFALAKLCGTPVEILSERTEWGESIVQPDGTVALSALSEPVRARDESGTWAQIDTTLEVGEDGLVRPVNTVSDMAFSGGGTGPLASMSDGERAFALTWPDDLPEPMLNGAKATYPDVIEGVDLVVTASAEGFSHDLVVKTAEAAASAELDAVEFGLEATGLDASLNASGGIELTDTDTSELFVGAAAPMMWDASAGSIGSQTATLDAESDAAEAPMSVNQPAPVGVELEGSVLRLVPDDALLEGTDTVFPVTIDPTWAPDSNGWITVSSLFPNTSYWKTSHLTNRDYFGDAGVGRSCRYTWDSEPFRARRHAL